MSISKLILSSGKRSTDPDFDYVKFLLHMEANSSNVFTDDVGNIIANTGVLRSPDFKRGGNYSAHFTGGNSMLQLPNGPYCKPGTQAFVYEGSFSTPYEPSQISSFGYCLLGSADGVYSPELAIFIDKTGLHFYWGSRGTHNTTLRAPFVFHKDTIYDWTIQRDESMRFSFWINGTLVPYGISYLGGTGLNTAASIGTNKPLNIGCLWQNQSHFLGYQDEMRATIGKSRYPHNQAVISRPAVFPGR